MVNFISKVTLVFPKAWLGGVGWLNVADVAKARSWLGSDDMRAAMQKSGVTGSPSIRFAAAA
jgi:hypothetical protein